jgi:hypothetical protein
MADLDVNIRLKAQDAASGVLANAAKNLRAMQRENVLAGETAIGRALGSAEGITGVFLDKLGLGIAGAFSVAILGTLQKMVTSAGELAAQYRAGSISAGEMTARLAAQIPILGQAFELGQSIRNIWDDTERIERNQLANLQNRAKYLNEVNDIYKKIVLTQREMIKDSERAIRRAGYGNDPHLAALSRVNDAHEDRVAKLDEVSKQIQLLPAGDKSGYERARENRKARDLEFSRYAAETAAINKEFEERKWKEEMDRQHANNMRVREETAENRRQLEAKKNAFEQQLKDEQAVRDIALRQALANPMGPFPAPQNNSALAGAYLRETITPNLVMGQGSGAAARQREESQTRDDTQRKQLETLKDVDEKMGALIGLIRSPQAGPPMLAGKF